MRIGFLDAVRRCFSQLSYNSFRQLCSSHVCLLLEFSEEVASFLSKAAECTKLKEVKWVANGFFLGPRELNCGARLQMDRLFTMAYNCAGEKIFCRPRKIRTELVPELWAGSTPCGCSRIIWHAFKLKIGVCLNSPVVCKEDKSR